MLKSPLVEWLRVRALWYARCKRALYTANTCVSRGWSKNVILADTTARAEYLLRKVNPRSVQQHTYLDIARKYTTPCKRVCYLVDKTRCQPGCVPRSTPANQTHVHRATPTQRYEVAQLQR